MPNSSANYWRFFMVITYFDRPIQTLIYKGFRVEYCRWDDGFRLISVDGVPHDKLRVSDFNFFLNVVMNQEGN